jgi:hypothetical protein
VTQGAFAAQPSVNLGGTSFIDGHGDPTGAGLTYQNYLSWSRSSSIRDANGNNVAAFRDPNINFVVDLNQFIYSFEVPPSAFAAPGLNLIVPLVLTDASFGPGGPVLRDNGFGLGDITLGAALQFKPILVDHHPVFAHRLELNFLAPTGKYDSTKSINPGSNAWHFNPSWGFTLYPIPRLEVSNRSFYLYNFKNDDPGVDPNNPAVVLDSTKSGQAIFDNFAVAFELLPFDPTRKAAFSIRAGLNGYVFKQITENEANGRKLTDSKEQTVGLGPGALWIPTNEDAVWLNVYWETAVENRFATRTVQLRWAHSFASF